MEPAAGRRRLDQPGDPGPRRAPDQDALHAVRSDPGAGPRDAAIHDHSGVDLAAKARRVCRAGRAVPRGHASESDAHGGAPASDAGRAVGDVDRVRFVGQLVRDPRPARRSSTENGRHRGLRPIPLRVELAHGRGDCGGAAAGQPAERSSGPVVSCPGGGVHAGAAGGGVPGGVHPGKHPQLAVARVFPALVQGGVRTRRLHSILLQQPDSGGGRRHAGDVDRGAGGVGDHPLSLPGSRFSQRPVPLAHHHSPPGAGRGHAAAVCADGSERQ
nr:hypothetical protein [Tanacetum cinerariifolium]